MVSNQIVDSDAFLDMPLSAQALYLHLLVRADDEGFSNSVKKVMRMIGSRDDDLKVLITKNFVIPFQSGVVVIKHWLIHNTIRKERIQKTAHTEERNQLAIKNNNSYTLKNAETSGELESGRHMSDIRQTDDGIDEISLDKSRLDKSSKDNVGKPDRIPYKEIIDFLNEQTESKYRHKTSKTKDLIKARWNDGFRLDDFKTVILKKTKEWKGKDMAKYLRPETLFGTKFESYLNQLDGGKPDTKVDWFEEYEKEQRGEKE